MAAAAAKAAALAAQHAQHVEEEYASWHDCADRHVVTKMTARSFAPVRAVLLDADSTASQLDRTESTGVMRLLVVSMALNDDKVKVSSPNFPSLLTASLTFRRAFAPVPKHCCHRL